ncbi:UNVERIFIED_CONTAM: hypothetical protein H355_000712 [Colinus virginianus]|nr:hypothetical protein H355_000712 [Colinus virginianus]
MKLFVVLALCCSFFSTRATPLPFEFLDCDDPDVFKAVDTALQKYNGDSTSANQFALYMVTEAKRTVGPDKQFHVKYEIRETTCATEENKIWKDCDYKAPTEARTGECTAQVYISNAEKTTNVSQDCKIVPVQPMIPFKQSVCLGCFHTISNDNPKLLEILEKAILKFNKESDEAALFKLVSTVEAKRQRTAKCDAKAHENHQEEIVHIASTCNIPEVEAVNPPTQVCPGCPSPVPTDSAELKELLTLSVEKYNLETNEDFYYKVGEIEAATVQVVAGQNYHLVFFIQKTNCSKKEFEKLHEDCEATTDSTAMVRMPPGFTPLRSFAVQVDETPSPGKNEGESQSAGEEIRKDDGQGPHGEGEPGHKHRHDRHGLKWDHEHAKRHRQEMDCGHRPGHRCGHHKRGKNGKHKHHRSESSEESSERVFNLKKTFPSSTAETASELISPEGARTETGATTEAVNPPDITLINGLLDHTESPLPKCPGKPWKQILDLSIPSILPRDFIDEDLLPSVTENIDLKTENPLSPQNKEMSFDLADALE